MGRESDEVVGSHPPYGSLEGYRLAQAALIADYDRIDQCYGRLRDWATEMDRMPHYAAESAQTETFRNLVFHGIAPDGTWQIE
jgi:hypothetical protein